MSSSDADPPGLSQTPPALIASRYQVIYPIGAGGMGTVVAARNVMTGREVALKLARGSVLGDATSYTTVCSGPRCRQPARVA